MNWKQIKKDCPKAWDKFVKTAKGNDFYYIDSQGRLCYTLSDEYYELRYLYDFFDEQGIYIDIIPRCHNEVVCFEAVGLQHYVSTNHRENKEFLFDDWEYLKYKTRIEAETAAFTEAFKILNK